MGKKIDIILANPGSHEFIRMLYLQRNVDRKDIRIITVSGKGGTSYIGRADNDDDYEILNVHEELSNHGVNAYNIGLDHAEADWVMFCDGRDTFSSVYSLWTLLHVLPVADVDILWTDGYREEAIAEKPGHINQTRENFTQVAGKLYRTEFLRKNKIRFGGMDWMAAEYAFNTVAIACTTPYRIMKIKSQIAPYVTTFRLSGTLSVHLLENMVQAAFHAAAELFRHKVNCKAETVKAMYYAYIATTTTPAVAVDLYAMWYFFLSFKSAWKGMSATEREVIFKEAYDDFINAFQIHYNTYGKEYMPPAESYKQADEWIAKYYASLIKPQQPRRVAVYSGTRNVYNDIITSMKSLLYHNRMDRVFVLAEDGTIGDNLPDCVTVINVSGQQYFPEDGPNYDTPWSYMVLMRAAYADIFDKESIVLSLDIDTIIQDDISDLFNTDMSGSYFAGVHEVKRTEQDDYCNFGVVLMNLDKLRDGKAEQIVRALNETRYDYPEQTAFNTMCSGNITLLPNRYNVTPYSHLTGDAERESIIHYAGIRYWKCFAPVRKYSQMSWDEVNGKENDNNA